MKDEEAVFIGQRLRHFRKMRKLTQNDVQIAIGISGLKKYEIGLHTPSYRILKLLKTFYGVSYDELLSADVNIMQNSIKEYNDPLDIKIQSMLDKNETGIYSLFHRGNKYFTRIHTELNYVVIKVGSIDNKFEKQKEIELNKIETLTAEQLKIVISALKTQIKLVSR